MIFLTKNKGCIVDNTDNNAVFNNTGMKKEWPYVAYVLNHEESTLEIFFNEKKGKVFLEDSARYGRHVSEIQRLFDEKIKSQIDAENDCWKSIEDEIETVIREDMLRKAEEDLEAGAIEEVHYFGKNEKIA